MNSKKTKSGLNESLLDTKANRESKPRGFLNLSEPAETINEKANRRRSTARGGRRKSALSVENKDDKDIQALQLREVLRNRDLEKESAGTQMSQTVTGGKPAEKDLESKLSQEELREMEGYKWDVVMVMPNPNSTVNDDNDQNSKIEKENVEDIIMSIQLAGLETYLYFSADGSNIICKIRASLKLLQDHASKVGYRMILDEKLLERQARDGVRRPDSEGSGYLIKPVKINRDPKYSRVSPFSFIHTAYRIDPRIRELFFFPDGLYHPFGSVHRIKLIKSILEERGELGGNLDISDLKYRGLVLAFFPLSDSALVDDLKSRWLSFKIRPWNQPMDNIRAYLGEKIAFYFYFLGHYTTWLCPFGIFGMIVCLDVVIEAGVDGSLAEALSNSKLIPPYGIFVAVWARGMLEMWKRAEMTKAMEWGMTEYEETLVDRSDFEGEEQISHINGKPIVYMDRAKQHRAYAISAIVIVSLVLLVIACVSLVFYIKLVMTRSEDDAVSGMAGTVASILSAVQIQILNDLYSSWAQKLTADENHRTDTDYEDALIMKLFMFQFVNSYAPLFYIAFIKESIGDKCQITCMAELSQSLSIIFVMRLVIGNAQELLVPMISGYLKRRNEESSAQHIAESTNAETCSESATPNKPKVEPKKLSIAEGEFLLDDYDVMMGTLEDYSELSVQFGYVSLFVCASPFSPLLAYVSNEFEIRVDGYKLLSVYRRPQPSGNEDIGTWMRIFEIIANISVVTNAGIICFTMDIVEASPEGKVWLFFFFQYIIFITMNLFDFFVDDVPEDVRTQMEREKFMVEKFVNLTEEDDEENDAEDLDFDDTTMPFINNQDESLIV